MGRYGLPDGCTNFTILDLSHPYRYILTDVGTLVSLAGDYEIDLELGDFCMDWMASYAKSIASAY